MTPEHRQFLLNTISPDSLWLLLAEAQAAGEGASIVRLGDGERALLALRAGEPPAPYLADESWLREYGLTGADLLRIAAGLHEATERATWLAPSPSGVLDPAYDLLPYLTPRDRWAPCYYGTQWVPCGRHRELLAGQRVALCTRQAIALAPAVAEHLGAPVVPLPVDSWRDRILAVERALEERCTAALVSAGPPGKLLTVELGDAGLLALDLGTSLRLWGGAAW